MTKKTRAKARRVLLTLSLVLVMMTVAVGGTIAYLTDSADEVKNTFTVGEIDIDLTETPNYDSNDDGKEDSWTAKLVPGNQYEKDPVVKVLANSEDCYLFVKVTETNNTIPNSGDPAKKYLEYTFKAEGWNVLSSASSDGVTVYYREVLSSTVDQSWDLLTTITEKNTIRISESLTNQNMPATDKTPTLSFQAYAAQKANLAVDAAWAQAQNAEEWDTGADKTGFGI